MESLEQVLNLKSYKIIFVNEVKKDNKITKVISVMSKNNKQRCLGLQWVCFKHS